MVDQLLITIKNGELPLKKDKLTHGDTSITPSTSYHTENLCTLLNYKEEETSGVNSPSDITVLTNTLGKPELTLGYTSKPPEPSVGESAGTTQFK
jgi:hypothetical protein